MKTFFKFMIYILIIISPMIIFFHFCYDILNYKYTAIINSENIEKMKEYLLLNNIEIKDELEKVTIHCIDWDEVEYILTYKDMKTEEHYIYTETEKTSMLTQYIIECSGKNDRLGLRFAIFIISIIASIKTISYIGKDEVIYED